MWHFCSVNSIRKIEKIQERALKIVHNDFEKDYERKIRKMYDGSQASSIFKTPQKGNPVFTEDLFHLMK